MISAAANTGSFLADLLPDDLTAAVVTEKSHSSEPPLEVIIYASLQLSNT